MSTEQRGEPPPQAHRVVSLSATGDLAIVEAALGPELVLNLVGDLTAENAGDLMARLMALRGEADVVLDMSGLASVDADGLGVLGVAFWMFRAEGGHLWLRHPTSDVRKIFEAARETEPFDIMLDAPS